MTTPRDEEAARAWSREVGLPLLDPEVASLAAFRAEARREALGEAADGVQEDIDYNVKWLNDTACVAERATDNLKGYREAVGALIDHMRVRVSKLRALAQEDAR